MRTKQRSSQGKVPRASLLITLTTIILFSCSQESLAQQQPWTTNGNDISNSNTGNVGVGTTTPGSKLDVNGRIQQTGSATDAGYLLTNGGLLTNTTALNPGIAFYGGNGVNALYGADLGFNIATGRYRTRLFSGHVLADVALGRQQDVQANPTQSAFIEFLTIRGDTGFVGIGTAAPQFNLEVGTPTQFLPGVNIMASTHPTSERASIGFGINATFTQGWAFGQDRSGTGTRDMFLFDVSNGRDLMYWGTNGNVGVGTIAPTFKLDVQGGQVNASGGLCIAGVCKTTWSDVGGAVSSVFGRTGTVLPQAGDYTWAQINKSTSSLADIAIRNAGDLSSGTLPDARFPTTLPAVSGANLTALNSSNLASGTVPIARLGTGTADSTKFLRGDNTWAVPSGGSPWTTSGTNIFYNAGNVGLGTATPNRRLELFHDIAGIGFEAGTGSPDSGVIRFGDGSGWRLHFGRSRNGTAAPLNSGTAGVIMTIQDNGNVGIGTHAPAFRLDVNGEINATGLRINGTPIPTGGAVSSVFGRTGAVVAATNDYTWAQINKSTSSLADIAIRSASDLSSGTLPNARFPTTLPAVSAANLTALNASNLASGTVPTARLGTGIADSTKFLRGDNTWAVPSGGSQWTTSGSNIFYNSGNVGIGTSSPNVKLHVAGDGRVTGNLTVDGNIAAKYQDLAEWVPAATQLFAGTVVVLDETTSNQVISSTTSYDTRVAGVISEQPGIVLGERGENKVLVATTGRVRVKVDATNGPIKIGDLLVTSNREGFAMKSLPVEIGGVRIHRPGTLIGKALEPLAKGTGEILVLLSLQ